MAIYYTTLLFLGSLCSFGVVGVYVRGQRKWWSNDIGKIIITLSLVDGLFYAWYLVVTFFPQIPGRNIIRLILFTVMTLAIVYRFFTMVKLARIVKRDKEGVSDEH